MTLRPVACCLGFAAALSAQTYLQLPATATPAAELPNYTLLPLMQVNSRVQLFYGSAEVGSTNFTADRLELRFDGPIPMVGYPGPFAIQRLRIAIGTTSVPMPGAAFASNLDTPLTEVFDAPWTFLPDPGSASPHPWGGPNGSLTFAFTTPVTVTVPSGSWLVVDLKMEGNNIANFGYSHALLDGANTSGGVLDGAAMPFGQGCALPGQSSASIGVTGVKAPGAAYFLNGQNLGANAPVFAIHGLSDQQGPTGPLPWFLPSTNCPLYTSSDFYTITVADAAGSLTGNPQGAAMAIPADPAFAGLNLFAQLAAYAPGANPLDVVLSDGLAVTLGTVGPLGRGTYLVAHSDDANATIGNTVRPFGMAMRLRTL